MVHFAPITRNSGYPIVGLVNALSKFSHERVDDIGGNVLQQRLRADE
jgi:hypothetical protein